MSGDMTEDGQVSLFGELGIEQQTAITSVITVT
jgi:hypothetical protein